ncbi:MAG TPA: MATE family efflux transporter [Bacteroidia bacterium]|nr:MATE family efflux transporter [Bacteroidia bacterium]
MINTLILYIRMLITVGISLYSTRLVLNALGAKDFGIYNLIAGIVSMMAFVNLSMTTATQRYLSFHQGKNDPNMQKKVFSNSLLLHLLIGTAVILALEVGGPFFFSGFLKIPMERIDAAKIIYHYMVISIFITIISSPFTGILMAHENMLWVAVVNIVEVLLRLSVAVYMYKIHTDVLIFYGWTMVGVSAISTLMYIVFCFKEYKECTFRMAGNFDRPLIKELSSFAGWNLFGAACGVGRAEAIAVILNIFFGTVINAAYGIANQVSNQMKFFSASLLRAMDPQIMKSEGAQNRKRMLRLSMLASKYGFFLLAFISIPCIFEMPLILKFWLKNVPDYTIVFCRLTLIAIMANQLTIGLQSGLQATGKIKAYQAVVGSIQLLNPLIAFLLLKIGSPAYSVLISIIAIELVACVFRIYFLKKLAGMSVKEYFKMVLLRELIPVFTAVLTCVLIVSFVHMPYRFLLTISVSATLFIIAVYFTGMEDDEKGHLKVLKEGFRSRIVLFKMSMFKFF